MPNYKMHVISHTHWDREWHLAFQQFRLRLVDLVDHLLEILDNEPEFRYFHLDGQTIVLEDYLQIRPQNEARLRDYIRQGRLLIGPWYQLNDENLVSGESTVRSLLVGDRVSRRFGEPTKIGYMPDQFGNISQMPQILLGFGINDVLYGRGRRITAGDDTMEAIWVGPDGSEILSSLMALWYNNAQRFPVDTAEAVSYVESIRDRMAPVAATNQLLLMNGVDHLEAQGGLGDIINNIQTKLSGDEIVHSTMPAYFADVRRDLQSGKIELQRIHGELRDSSRDRTGPSVLAGTLSTRIYLKQANVKCEVMLEKYAEPSGTFAALAGGVYHADALFYAWKLLMQNHPHDSICGCSSDQVHYEMMPRFDQVKQIGQELTNRSLEYVASQVKTDSDSIVVFNTLSWPRTEKVEVSVAFPLSDIGRGQATHDFSRDVKAFEIVDSGGHTIPFKVLENKVVTELVLSPTDLPMAVGLRRVRIEFIAEDIPCCGYKTYSIKPRAAWHKTDANSIAFTRDNQSVTNGVLALRPSRGGIAIYDVSSPGAERLLLDGQCVIEDCGDVGDEYNHTKPIRDRLIIDSAEGDISIVDNGPISISIVRKSVIKLPQSAAPNFQGRSEEMVECPVAVTYTLAAGSPRVDVSVEFENKAKDHRLRAVFPAGFAADISHAEMPYDVVSRPAVSTSGTSAFHPQKTWVDLSNGSSGFAVLNRGLPEYEVYQGDESSLAITLLRCVGHLSGSGETPTAVPTPGAQCIDTYKLEYSIYPHSGTWLEAAVWQQAHAFNASMICVQTGAHDGHLPLECSFVKVEPSELVVTALKKPEDRSGIIVRFFNIADYPVNGRIKVMGVGAVREINLNEDFIRDIFKDDDGSVHMEVGARKIISLEFDLS